MRSFFIVILITNFVWFLSGCDFVLDSFNKEASEKSQKVKGGKDESEVIESPVGIKDIKVGDGAEVNSGKWIEIAYIGKLPNGEVFDSTKERNQNFQFMFAGGKVIEGLEIGMKGMKVGGVRIIKIPSELAYGSRGIPRVVPSNTDLVFEVSLLKIIDRK